MPSTSTPEQTPKSHRSSAAHQPFSWFADDVKDYPIADFVALTMDICGGIQTCLEIIHVSDLARSSNAELDPEEAKVPTLNAYDATKLLRQSIASAALLQEIAAKKIDWINTYGAGHLQNMKDRANERGSCVQDALNTDQS